MFPLKFFRHRFFSPEKFFLLLHQSFQPPPNSYDRGRYIKEPRDQRQPGEDRTQKQGKQKQGKQDRSGIERLQKKPETADVVDEGNPYEGLNLL